MDKPYGGFHSHGGYPQNWMFFKGKSQSMNGWYLGVLLWRRKPPYINWCTISSTVSSQNIPTKLKNHGSPQGKEEDTAKVHWSWFWKRRYMSIAKKRGYLFNCGWHCLLTFFFSFFSQLLEVHNIKLKYIGWSKLRSPGLQNAYSPKEDVSGP